MYAVYDRKTKTNLPGRYSVFSEAETALTAATLAVPKKKRTISVAVHGHRGCGSTKYDRFMIVWAPL